MAPLFVTVDEALEEQRSRLDETIKDLAQSTSVNIALIAGIGEEITEDIFVNTPDEPETPVVNEIKTIINDSVSTINGLGSTINNEFGDLLS